MSQLIIDGSYGEGGGQILRTSLALAAVTGTPIRLIDIRAGRKKPGLAAQHLSAVRAVAAICGARVSGDALGSQTLDFAPAGELRAGDYSFDVAEAREGGSAGSTTLVLQSVLPPLALAGSSALSVRGGTHVAWSPPFDYVRDVWLPFLAEVGVTATLELDAWGWYPVGRGAIHGKIRGVRRDTLRPLARLEKGKLRRIKGRAVAAELPAHIPKRMADRARVLLAPCCPTVQIEPRRVRAACAGAGIFLTAEYEGALAGFSALGEKGKPAEAVAEEAVGALVSHAESDGALDIHLADQVLVPLALARGASRFTVQEVSLHLRTNAWAIEQFGIAQVTIAEKPSGVGLVLVGPLRAG